MSDTNQGFFSLADLAAFNTDEVVTLTSRVPTPGLYTVVGKVAGLKMTVSNDDSKPPLIRLGVETEVMDFLPIDKTIDVSKFIGRKLSDSITLWPNEMEQEIGLLKGRYQKAGISNIGMMGGVEGQPPGWIDNAIGAIWQIKVGSFVDKNGETRARMDWQALPKDASGEIA